MAGYKTDLTDEQWRKIVVYFPRARKRGRPRVHPLRSIVNAIFYATKTGCAWEMLPNDFPPKGTVCDYYYQWIENGLWEKINKKLSEQVRVKEGREIKPSAAIIDSQSVKSAGQAGAKGYDGGKKIKGVKRHILVDVFGLVIACLVTAANVSDRAGASILFGHAKPDQPRIEKVWADGSYTGPLVEETKKNQDWSLEIIKPVTGKGPGFHVRPWCWRVERTFGWLNKYRRLSKNYEVHESTAENLIFISMTQIMLKRLA